MKSDTVIIIGLFLAIIAIGLWFSTTPAYSAMCSASRLPHANFEGFTSLNYSSLSDGSSPDNAVNKHIIGGNTAYSKLGGSFDGLYVNPNADDSNVDLFSKAKGDLSGAGASSGYSNSMGPLVLTPEMLQALKTRGGNTNL